MTDNLQYGDHQNLDHNIGWKDIFNAFLFERNTYVLLTCWTIMVSASSWVVLRSCRSMRIPVAVLARGPGISAGTGSGPVTTRLCATRSTRWAIRSWIIMLMICTLLDVTENRSDCAGRRDVFLSLKTLLAPFSRFQRVASLVLPAIYLTEETTNDTVYQ